jgi:chemosensory pili system protein ChpB (putative protein-glutamate methylesterase)
MAEPAANGVAPRVVLLARTGKAADQLAEALRQAGADLLIAVDPAQTDEAVLRSLSPQAVLVALEPSIEPALDALEGLLSDPALTVIFDEADLAAHRAGWDAARWVRHLAAKLRHDSNVLPPGAESETDLQPTPGAPPKPAAAYTDADFDAFAREAKAVADSVPVDASPGEAPPSLPRAETLELDSALLDAIPATSGTPWTMPSVFPPPLPAAPAPAPVPEPSAVRFDDLALVDDESLTLESVELDSVAFDNGTGDTLSIESLEIESAVLDSVSTGSGIDPVRFDDDAFFLDELSAGGQAAGSDAGIAPFTVDGGFEAVGNDFGNDFGDFDSESASPAPAAREPERVLSFEELIAASLPRDDAPPAPASAGPPPLPAASVEPASAFSFGDLSLAPVEDAPVTPAAADKPRVAPAAHDLSALEARISALSLVDIDEDSAARPESASPFAAPGSGAVVLIEAGLGGPDPTRQLLAALPAEFPPTVLVRLHLQGGRYDRLVAQMGRAAALPVALAEAGTVAGAGTIYFLPEGIGIAVSGGRLGFVADAMPAAGLFAALPAGQSALVFLSGADPQLVDPALASAAAGTLVVAQTPEDCYDGTSCAELRSRGTVSGLPVELAGRLAARWPS